VQRPVDLGELRPQVERGPVGDHRELRLGRSPREVGAARDAEQRVPGPTGRRIKRHELRELARELRPGGERTPGDDRHRALGEPGHHGLEAGAPARNVGHCHEHALAAREEVARDAGEALTATILDDGGGRDGPVLRGLRSGARGGRGSVQRTELVPEGALLAQNAELARLRGAQGAQDHARLHHSLPAVLLQAERDVVGLACRGRERLRG
jgi:hypothetical protein